MEKSIADIIKAPKTDDTSKIVNERQLLIKDFLDKINAERKGTKYKPLSARAVAIKLSHLSEFDLKYFYKQCDSYKGEFGKCFFGALKQLDTSKVI